MLRDRFQVLPSQARRLLSVLDWCGIGFVLTVFAAAVRRVNLDSTYRDLSLPHARRLRRFKRRYVVHAAIESVL